MSEAAALFAAEKAEAEACDDLYETKASVAIPFLNGQTLPLAFFPEDTPFDAVIETLDRLLKVGPDQRPRAEDLIWEDLQFVIDVRKKDYPTLQDMLNIEGADRDFGDLLVPQGPADLWRLMKAQELFFSDALEGDVLNAIIVFDVAWDIEHQVGLFFRDGAELVAAADPSSGV